MVINTASEKKLIGVHPDLVNVVRRTAAIINEPGFGFVITCGPRTLAEQKRLVAIGASKTLRSRHIPGKNGLAHAVDFAVTVNGKVRWDWPLYAKLAVLVKQAAREVGVPIEWGGDWKSFRDGPHYQLPWAKYPA
jgi:peptidoglycan L-alanyl-D-glutamate endopeptidase CwlK